MRPTALLVPHTVLRRTHGGLAMCAPADFEGNGRIGGASRPLYLRSIGTSPLSDRAKALGGLGQGALANATAYDMLLRITLRRAPIRRSALRPISRCAMRQQRSSKL